MNLSNRDTNGAEEVSLLVRCPHFRGCKSGIYLGWEKVSCLERCPQFRSVLIHNMFPYVMYFYRYYVNRDTLFSHHKASEAFLHHLMALYVSSHYKNTPNDLQLLSDAPAHHVFVLVPPVLPSSATLPDILCVLQVSVRVRVRAYVCLVFRVYT